MRPSYEAAFNARLASKLVESGYAIRWTDRDFELASVSRELIEKFSKRTKMIEQIAREKYTGRHPPIPRLYRVSKSLRPVRVHL